MTLTNVEHSAIIVDWHDGDTCKVIIDRDLPMVNVPNMDLMFGDFIKGGLMYSKKSIRLWGLNTPELHVGGAKNETGYAAKEYVKKMCPAGTRIRIKTLPNPEKYGRWLGIIFFMSGNTELCLNKLILENTKAIPYLQGELRFW